MRQTFAIFLVISFFGIGTLNAQEGTTQQKSKTEITKKKTHGTLGSRKITKENAAQNREGGSTRQSDDNTWGTILFIAIVVLVIVFIRRRNRNASQTQNIDLQDDEAPIRCPRCGSRQISANNVKKASGVGVLLFGVGAGLAARNKVMITCLKCGKQWKAGSA